MNNRKKILTMAVAGVLGTSLLVSGGTLLAAEAKPSTETPAATASAEAESSLIRIDDEANTALREIRASRVAIFNGDPVAAAKLAEKAEQNLALTEKASKDLAVKTEKGTEAGDSYVPFDVSIALTEGFVPTQEKNGTLKTANEHLSKGDHKKAVDVLKLANIDVSVSAALLPSAWSLHQVRDAVTLMGEKKYYEANLALESVEDSVIVESYDVDAIPAQGTKS